MRRQQQAVSAKEKTHPSCSTLSEMENGYNIAPATVLMYANPMENGTCKHTIIDLDTGMGMGIDISTRWNRGTILQRKD
jgi:hypothetical protein